MNKVFVLFSINDAYETFEIACFKNEDAVKSLIKSCNDYKKSVPKLEDFCNTDYLYFNEKWGKAYCLWELNHPIRKYINVKDSYSIDLCPDHEDYIGYKEIPYIED
jgi:hypothetical protein